MSGNILGACCTLGRIRIEHELAVLHQVFPLARTFQYRVYMGLSTEDARNWACKQAIEEDAEYLLFWDDDMIPRSPSAVASLVSAMTQAPEIDVLGGVYPMRRRDAPEPIVIKEPSEGVWWGWEDGKVHKVYMTGTGFTMIRTESLRRFDVEMYGERELPRIFGRKTIQTEEHSGHMADDEYFAELCKGAGLSWYVAGNVICDQIEMTGYIYRVEDAKVLVPA